MGRVWAFVQEACQLYRQVRRMEHRIALKARRNLLRAELDLTLAKKSRIALQTRLEGQQRKVPTERLSRAMQYSWETSRKLALENALRNCTENSHQAEMGKEQTAAALKRVRTRIAGQSAKGGALANTVASMSAEVVDELEKAPSLSYAEEMLINRIVSSAATLKDPEKVFDQALSAVRSKANDDDDREAERLRGLFRDRLANTARTKS